MIFSKSSLASGTAKCMVACAGYYNYDKGYRPDFPGEKTFKGEIIHPHHWPGAFYV